ncbi:hypothetical protein [Leifsonia shinshuensis]|uniref:hypothetical protein n=1 Tax=Leifsonia shinshuensis TaxID=150026 RepID=UPI002861A7EF|nr:hypothetical protein [Leifsonia shinshuensis]MDR6972260.1 hypothetical protein [Leifsonia shinshuensis]
MDQSDDDRIFTPGFRSLCLSIVFGTPFLVGSTLLVIAWVRAANYTGVGEGVHDILLWGFWLAVIGLIGLLPVAALRGAGQRNRASHVIHPG